MSSPGTEEVDPRTIEVMRGEIDTIPTVIADVTSSLRPAFRELASETAGTLGEIIVTGCGDSYFAGIAARLAFERATGLRCRAVEALELARYEARYVPRAPRPLLVAVSYSGEVGRTIEAAATGVRLGWETIALTGREAGRLARSVERPVLMHVPTLGFSPGTSTYVGMVAALLVLAAELARAHGRGAEAAALDDALARAPELASATLVAAGPGARAAAESIAVAPWTMFLGAGPSRASAAFGAAKLFEGAQRYGTVQDLEEWAHEQYFVSGPTTPIVVIAPSGASHDRAVELLEEMAYIGAPAYLVSDAPRPDSVPPARYLPVATGLDESASALLTSMPLALIGFQVSRILGTRSYGFPSADREREHYETIHRDTRGPLA